MTKQEIFDKVVTHARQQKCKSMDYNDKCLYRGPGTKCFIGALIPDEKYNPKFEGLAVNEPMVYEAAGIGEDQVNFARSLQDIHDIEDPLKWESYFESLSNANNLNMPSK